MHVDPDMHSRAVVVVVVVVGIHVQQLLISEVQSFLRKWHRLF